MNEAAKNDPIEFMRHYFPRVFSEPFDDERARLVMFAASKATEDAL